MACRLRVNVLIVALGTVEAAAISGSATSRFRGRVRERVGRQGRAAARYRIVAHGQTHMPFGLAAPEQHHQHGSAGHPDDEPERQEGELDRDHLPSLSDQPPPPIVIRDGA